METTRTLIERDRRTTIDRLIDWRLDNDQYRASRQYTRITSTTSNHESVGHTSISNQSSKLRCLGELLCCVSVALVVDQSSSVVGSGKVKCIDQATKQERLLNHAHRRDTCLHNGRSGSRCIGDSRAMMQSEEVIESSWRRHRCWRFDRAGARCIDDGHSMMRCGEECGCNLRERGYRHVDQAGARCIDDDLSMLQSGEECHSCCWIRH